MKRNITLVTLIMAAFFTVRAAEASLFPQIAGWKVQEDKRVYNAGDLWELINGAADIFLSYYFLDLHIAEYSNRNMIIRVELYRHGSLANAYGIFTAERMPDYPQVTTGSLGYKSQGVLNFLTGNYYVKVMSAGVTEADENSIALIAARVDEQLAQPEGLPDELRLFPENGKVMFSEGFTAQNFLGYSFFRSAFTARYGNLGEMQLFIIRLTPEEVQKMLSMYIAIVKEDKVQQKDGLYIISDLFNGTVFITIKGNTLAGVVGSANEDIAREYLDLIAGKIP